MNPHIWGAGSRRRLVFSPNIWFKRSIDFLLLVWSVSEFGRTGGGVVFGCSPSAWGRSKRAVVCLRSGSGCLLSSAVPPEAGRSRTTTTLTQHSWRIRDVIDAAWRASGLKPLHLSLRWRVNVIYSFNFLKRDITRSDLTAGEIRGRCNDFNVNYTY